MHIGFTIIDFIQAKLQWLQLKQHSITINERMNSHCQQDAMGRTF
jgi:hypothetical protein